MARVVFARIGWMKWYRGPQPDDEKPIGGGSYNSRSLGYEAFNFFPSDDNVFGYFQPTQRRDHPSKIALERIEAGFAGEELKDVLAVFVATDPKRGGQCIVGWFPDATVYRHERPSNDKRRNCLSYFIKASAEKAVLIPKPRREFTIPSGKGAFGRANVCYPLDTNGRPKRRSQWIDNALEYIDSYDLENVVREPESDADADIEQTLGITIDHVAGFQSNPQIRRAIEEYAMRWAERRLEELGYKLKDTHKNKPYDFRCEVSGVDLYVEVKGTQDNGTSVSLSPNEVEHARRHANSALFIVHSVKVKGKRNPVVSGGRELLLNPWDISTGTLKPRGYVFTLGRVPKT